jgi:hypothetical protein
MAEEATVDLPRAMSIEYESIVDSKRYEQKVVDRDEKRRLWSFVQSHLRQEVTIPTPAAALVAISYVDMKGVAHKVQYNAGDDGFLIDGRPGRLTKEQRKALSAIVLQYFDVKY